MLIALCHLVSPPRNLPRQKFGAAYEEELLHVRPPVARRKSKLKQCWNSLYMESYDIKLTTLF